MRIFHTLTKQPLSKLYLVCFFATCWCQSSLDAYETVCQDTRSPWKVTIEGPFVAEHDRYTVCYDARTQTPLWVYEYLTVENLSGDAERPSNYFRLDQEIPKRFQGRHDDYTNSGYDRGHMAAAANHTDDEGHMKDTFLVTNIAPQVGDGFNSGGGWWLLERKIRTWVASGYRAHVISGPLFLPDDTSEVSYEVIGKSDIAVPTHFFKVVLLENTQGQVVKERAYILPNRRFDGDETLGTFKAEIADVELQAGLAFTRVRR